MKQIRLFIAVLLFSVTFNSTADLPEFPFCPLGGPTGWMNRLFDDDDYPPPRLPPPGFYSRYPAHPYFGYPGRYPPALTYRRVPPWLR